MKVGPVRFLAILSATVFAVAFAEPHATAQSAQVAQSTQGTLRGTVTDPSGAAVAQAAVVMMSVSGQFTTAKTNSTGAYEIKGLAPGSYTLTINADGFAVFEQDSVQISVSQIQTVNATLALASQTQTVQITGQAVGVAVNPEENASAVVIQGKDLEALSDDPDELQNELEALAGPSAGPNGGQMYIDGFQAGQLPPKSSIREIRINQDPFSAEYAEMGYGRIEIFTKPGTDKLHGDFFVIGNDSAFNTLDPFITASDVPPPYHTVQFSGDVSGPLSKKASYFFQVEQRNINQASVVDATTSVGAGPDFTPIVTQDTVLNPQTRTTISPRLDLQLTKNNTITLRYQFTHSGATNSDIGQFALPSLGVNTSSTENTVQISDTQIFGPRVLTDTQFQYVDDKTGQTAQSTSPEILVPGDFTGGGNSIGKQEDDESHYEFQSYTQITLAKNAIRFGARLDDYQDKNSSNENFNGTFQFPSINAYQTYITDSRLGMSDAAIVAAGGGASQYSVITGMPTSRVGEFAMGLYAEDDWRVKPTLTLSYGLRYETQTNISDHDDWAPRLSLSWAIGHSKAGPKTVVRAGYGIFYNRFNYTNTLEAERLNGTTQQQYVVTDPAFFPTDAPPPSSLAGSLTSPTIYQVAPNLRAPYQNELGASVEQQITKSATLSFTYLNSLGLHQFLTNNVNAPLPGTYNPADPSSESAIRPLSATYGDDNVYQYQSEGIFHQIQFIVNLNYKLGGKVSVFGYYTLNYADADTNGINSNPSNPYNLMADYGRAAFDVRDRVFFGGTINLAKGVRLNPLIAGASGTPFNITVGQDLTGDSFFNDRPGIATGANISRPSVIDAPQFGYLDTDPIPGEALIPINDGTGPSEFTFNLRISKTFSFGRQPESTSNNRQQGGAGGGGGGRGGGAGGGGFGGGGGGRGGGGGGRGGGGGQTGGAPTSKHYNLTLSANIRNLFNIANLGVPSGQVGSPVFDPTTETLTGVRSNVPPLGLFDRSNSMAGMIYSSNSSDRRIDLQMIFTF
jgi:hypothetical protein